MQCRDYYPDNYDITQKMQGKFFTHITPILELARQGEYMAAAEVMIHVATAILTSRCSIFILLNKSAPNCLNK